MQHLVTLTYSDKKINLLVQNKDRSIVIAQIDLSPRVVENSIIVNQSEFAKILKTAVENKLKISASAILHCAIPEEKSFIQILQIPQVPLDKINQVIKWQSKSLLTFDIDNVYLDTQIIESSHNKLKILATAAPKKLVDSLIQTIKQTEYQIGAIDTRCGALARFLAAKPHELIAIAEIEDKVATLILAKNSIARLSSSVDLTDKNRPFIGKVKELIEFYTSRKETDKQVERLYLIGEVLTKEAEQWEKSLGLKIILVSKDELSQGQAKGIPDSFSANLGLLGDLSHGVNLLPQPEVKEILQSNIILQIKHGLEFLLGMLIILMVITLLVYFNVGSKIDQSKTNTKATPISNLSSAKLTQLQQIASQIGLLPPIKNRSPYLIDILNTQIDGINITEIDIGDQSGTIKGSANNREALIKFVEKIKRQDIYGNVFLPLSNYETIENVPMEIQFKLK